MCMVVDCACVVHHVMVLSNTYSYIIACQNIPRMVLHWQPYTDNFVVINRLMVLMAGCTYSRWGSLINKSDQTNE